MSGSDRDAADVACYGIASILEAHLVPLSRGLPADHSRREIIIASFPAPPFTNPDMPMTTPESEPHPAPPAHGFARRNWGKLTLFAVIVVPCLVFTIWAGVALNFTYSSGQRVGFVQKFSRKGWICKTWEGELAIVNMPGAMSQIFDFSVRSDSVARAISDAMAKGRVELEYSEHRGVPTSCFGETRYFVTGVKAAGSN